MLDEEIRYRMLRELERDPQLSQRDLAERLGVSVGKTNYCLKALVEKGWSRSRIFDAAAISSPMPTS